jgi:hypothetical protein
MWQPSRFPWERMIEFLIHGGNLPPISHTLYEDGSAHYRQGAKLPGQCGNKWHGCHVAAPEATLRREP